MDKLRNISRIDKVDCPVLVIHSRDDDVIPFWHGEALYRKAREPKRCCWLEGATHNVVPAEAQGASWAAIHSFTESLKPVAHVKTPNEKDAPGERP